MVNFLAEVICLKHMYGITNTLPYDFGCFFCVTKTVDFLLKKYVTFYAKECLVQQLIKEMGCVKERIGCLCPNGKKARFFTCCKLIFYATWALLLDNTPEATDYHIHSFIFFVCRIIANNLHGNKTKNAPCRVIQEALHKQSFIIHLGKVLPLSLYIVYVCFTPCSFSSAGLRHYSARKAAVCPICIMYYKYNVL